MKIAFIFPGQGSQSVGMGRNFFERFAEARAVFEEADAALGEKLSALCFEGPEETLKLTANTQPAILTTSCAALAVLKSRGIHPAIVAGHSLGEYSALVAAGALRSSEAAQAVRRRGELMQKAVPTGQGAMAAVLGLSAEKVSEVCAEVERSSGQTCAPANFNDPGQTVIAGGVGAVEIAGQALKAAGAKRVLPLPVSAPFHCAMMKAVEGPLRSVLEKIAWKPLAVPVIANVDAQANADASRLVDLLVKQVTAPVRWVACVEEMKRQGVTHVVEVGPGRVLSGLVKRIAADAFVLANVEDEISLEKTLEVLRERQGMTA